MTATGSEIECDVVVTATGLKLVQSPGNIEISVDGTPMKLREHVTYRGAMRLAAAYSRIISSSSCVGAVRILVSLASVVSTISE